jgi:hypothetical protein
LPAERPVNNSYTIFWRDAAVSGDGSVITLYYDTDTNPGNGNTQIVTGITPNGTNIGNYVWNTSAIPVGNYYIYGTIDNGTYENHDYSSGYVLIAPPVNPTNGGTGEDVYSWPNPFRPLSQDHVNIAYEVKKDGWTRVYIYNLAGERVWQHDNYASAGQQSILNWDGHDAYGRVVANGVYLLVILDDNRKLLYKGRMTVLD